jgi:hypothetical protein
MNNVILGTAVGYDISAIQAFILSLMKSKYKGRVVLFVDDLNNDTAKYLREKKVDIHSFGSIILPINIQRFFLYKRFIEQEHHISHIMITDVRDVIFQDDPFTFCNGNNLYCFEEDKSMTLASCPINSGWLLQAYGPNVLSEIGHNTIICAGITIGSYEKIIQYLANICNELTILPPLWGIDQAAHNVIARSHCISSTLILPNEGPVYTLELVKCENIKMDKDGFIVNDFGIPSVVHQYDRHAFLKEAIQKRYGIF